MPRANRYYVPGMVYHLTHRCHDRAFLFKFKKDRRSYIRWLFEAKKRYGLCVLNFTVTSNHVHILVYDNGRPSVIERSMQLAQGSFAGEYNRRKGRLGAFWQDRYHATIVQSGRHLRRCMTYIDLNMVRAGVVSDPFDWPSAGMHQIQNPPARYKLIDLDMATRLLGFDHADELARWQREQLSLAGEQTPSREPCWTEALAVGNRQFLEKVQIHLGTRIQRCQIVENHDGAVLQEEPVSGNF